MPHSSYASFLLCDALHDLDLFIISITCQNVSTFSTSIQICRRCGTEQDGREFVDQ